MSSPAERLAQIPLGQRIVVRSRVGDAATDTLGYLRARSAATCELDTRRGPRTLAVADIIAVKPIPPPPRRRRPG